MRYILPVICLCALTGCAATSPEIAPVSNDVSVNQSAAGEIANNLDRYFAPLADTADMSGIIRVEMKDQPPENRVFGWADWESRTPHRSDTLYSAASVTKSVTAATLVALQRDGVLSLDDPAGKWLPALVNYPDMTLQRILQHRAGLPREIPDGFAATGQNISDWLAGNPSEISSHGKESYSNVGYALLAETIAAADGRSFAESAKVSVLNPAGMGNSSIIAGLAGDVGGGAKPYTAGPAPHGVMTPVPSGLEIGSSGLVTTASDLARWARVLADGAYPELFEGDDSLGSIDTGSDARGEYVSLQGTLPGFAANAIAWKNGALTISYLGNIFSYPALNMRSRLISATSETTSLPNRRPPDLILSTQHEKLSGSYMHPDFGRVKIARNDAGNMMLTMPEKPAYWSFYLTPISGGKLHWRAFNVLFNIDAEGSIMAGDKAMTRITSDL